MFVIIVFTVLIAAFFVVISSFLGKSFIWKSFGYLHIIFEWSFTFKKNVISLCSSRRNSAIIKAVNPVEILQYLQRGKLFPLSSANGWRFCGSAGTCQAWAHDAGAPFFLPPCHMTGADTTVPVEANICSKLLRHLPNQREWNLTNIQSVLLEQSHVHDEDSKNWDPACSQPDWDIVEMTSKRRHLLAWTKNTFRLSFIKEDWCYQTNIYERYWNREESGCCWLLLNAKDRSEWIFYLAQPSLGTSHCVLNVIRCAPSPRWYLPDHYLTSHLQSFRNFVIAHNQSCRQLDKLTLPDATTSQCDRRTPIKTDTPACQSPVSENCSLHTVSTVHDRVVKVDDCQGRGQNATPHDAGSLYAPCRNMLHETIAEEERVTDAVIETYTIIERLGPSQYGSCDDLTRSTASSGSSGSTASSGSGGSSGSPGSSRTKISVKNGSPSECGKHSSGERKDRGSSPILGALRKLSSPSKRKDPLVISRKHSPPRSLIMSPHLHCGAQVGVEVVRCSPSARLKRSATLTDHDLFITCREQKLSEWLESTNVTHTRNYTTQSLGLTCDTQYQQNSTLCAAQVAAELAHVANLDLSLRTEEQARVTCGWVFSAMDKDVVVLKKTSNSAGSSIHSLMGKGLIKASPRCVWDAIRNPRTRFTYDDTLKKMEILHEFGSGLKVVHMQHEVAQLFKKESRDFCVLHGEKIDGDRYILTMSSIDWLPCPVRDETVRGQFLSSGWVVEPAFKDGRIHSMVTYLSQMNLKTTAGNMVDEIAVKQPMAIAQLRHLLLPNDKIRACLRKAPGLFSPPSSVNSA